MSINELFEFAGIGAIYGFGLGVFVRLLSYAIHGALSILKQAN